MLSYSVWLTLSCWLHNFTFSTLILRPETSPDLTVILQILWSTALHFIYFISGYFFTFFPDIPTVDNGLVQIPRGSSSLYKISNLTDIYFILLHMEVVFSHYFIQIYLNLTTDLSKYENDQVCTWLQIRKSKGYPSWFHDWNLFWPCLSWYP